MMEEADAQRRHDEIEGVAAIYGDDFGLNPGTSMHEVRCHPSNLSSDVILAFQLPPGYPSSEPPVFSLREDPARSIGRGKFVEVSESLVRDFHCHMGEEAIFRWVLLVSELFSSSKKDSRVKEHYDSQKKKSIEWKHGEAITDRKSVFIAHVAHVATVEEAMLAVSQLVSDRHISTATHNLWAYRFESASDRNDDGESGAAERLLFLLERMNATNVVVVVSRWYGGTKLGPVRFRHITTSAKDLLQAEGFGTMASSGGSKSARKRK